MIELSHKPLIRAFNCDCMGFMAGVGDKAYSLACCDPPYGIGEDGKSNSSRGTLRSPPTIFVSKTWDREKPSDYYFRELRRVSLNQIIFGGNFFLDYLPATPCMIVWDKDNTGDFADCELAWTSFKSAVRKFTWRWNGMLQQNMANKEIRIHPTQKPVALYRWLLTNYAKPGQRIIDTHGGSFSSAIACWHEGYDMDIVELDTEYFEAACERFERETRQQKLFPTPGGK